MRPLWAAVLAAALLLPGIALVSVRAVRAAGVRARESGVGAGRRGLGGADDACLRYAAQAEDGDEGGEGGEGAAASGGSVPLLQPAEFTTKAAPFDSPEMAAKLIREMSQQWEGMESPLHTPWKNVYTPGHDPSSRSPSALVGTPEDPFTPQFGPWRCVQRGGSPWGAAGVTLRWPEQAAAPRRAAHARLPHVRVQPGQHFPARLPQD
jgi:hypothetical protein